MPRKPDSAHIDLIEVFRRVQTQMLSDLSVGGLFEHASSAGAATEHHWINLFERYLPRRYRAAPAFVIDADGGRSRQIDIAIFDNLYSPPLFPHEAGLHLPAESVYAVFEVKPTISKQWLRDAAEKAASVRALRRTSVPVIAGGNRAHTITPSPILAGLLAASSVWSAETFGDNVRRALTPPSRSAFTPPSSRALAPSNRSALWGGPPGPRETPRSRLQEIGDGPKLPSLPRKQNKSDSGRTVPNFKTNQSAMGTDYSVPSGHKSSRGPRIATARGQSCLSPLPCPLDRIDLGCSLKHGAFECADTIRISNPDESLIFFMLRLLDRLRAMGTAPAADLMEYGRSLQSFQR